MTKGLLQEIDQMRADLMRLVEQGCSVLDPIVLEKSQALDLLIAAYLQAQTGYYEGSQG